MIAPLNEDGVFGPLTEASVRAFQTFFGLNPDGIIGPLTWARIVDVNASLPNITAPRFPGNLQNGSRGDNVRVLQQHLNDLVPFYPSITRLNPDGIFGPITQEAVREFQRLFGMAQSGIANQITWKLVVSMRNLLTGRQAAQVFAEFHDFHDGEFHEAVHEFDDFHRLENREREGHHEPEAHHEFIDYHEPGAAYDYADYPEYDIPDVYAEENMPVFMQIEDPPPAAPSDSFDIIMLLLIFQLLRKRQW